MQNDRRSIPAEVARRLRHESGFGCCFCGHPFIQYHHIIPWAIEQHYRFEDMMAVCGQCHHIITTGGILEEEQREAKLRPKNVVDGLALGKLYVTNRELIVRFGPVRAIETPDLITWRDNPVLRIARSEDERILVTALIQDQSGRPIAAIRENEWFVPIKNVWDFEVKTKRASVRLAPRHIAFDIDARGQEIVVAGSWTFNGFPIKFGPHGCDFGAGNIIMGGTYSHCRGLIGLDH